MSEPTGLPAPPPEGTSALPPGTFDDVVVAVTGGGTGLGKAIGVEFARLGAAIAILSRSPEHLEAGVDAVEAAGGRAIGAECDIRDPGVVAAAFDAVETELGLPGVLVNNAAGNFPVPAEDLSPNGWRAVLGIVLDGTFYMSREFGRRHIAAGTPGSILNVGASYAWTGGPGFAHSAAAKAAVKNLTETLAVEWAPYGIRVNGLVPGLFPHEDEVEQIRAVPGRGENEHANVPALRVGEVRELGWAATFLASPFAGYITGATLTVDGANWQRRNLMQPPFRPIRDQLGKEPFTP
jgi:NAD(P)-dependent dehydrogenase (short-subunit alcohol dehydrogenase family)